MTRSSHRPSRPAAVPGTAGPRPVSFLRRSLSTAVLAGAAGTALLAGATAPAWATEPPSTGAAAGGGLADLEKSLVLVGIDWAGSVQFPTEDGDWAWSAEVDVTMSCTGWFASTDGDIVTAGHCVDPEEVKADILHEFLARNDALDLEASAAEWPVAGMTTNAPQRLDTWVVQSPAVEGAVIEDPLVVQVVDSVPPADGDLALLKASGLAEPTTPLPVATDEPAVGDAVTAIGYPANVGSVSDPSRLRASFKSGSVSSAQVTTAGVPVLEINADLSGGMSGGPTVDANGRVIGVNSSTFVEQSFNFITDSQGLRVFLDEHGIEVATAPATGETLPVGTGRDLPTASPRAASTSGLPLWQLLAGGSVLLAAAGGAYRLARRSPAVAVPQPAGSGRPDATRLVGRPVFAGAPVPPRSACTHANSPLGARFCPDCGSRPTA